MAESVGSNGAGPADAVTAFLQTAVDAAKRGAVAPMPDPRVSAGFALGWQMAELYRPDAKSPVPPASGDDLPGLGKLEDDERLEIAITQVEAALAKFADVAKSAKLGMPNTDDLRAHLEPPEARTQAVRKLHVHVLSTFTAADFRLGKAYGLGRALADTCRHRANLDELGAEFKPHRIAKLRSWLDDLASAFPPHAGKSVSDSLRRWATALDPQQSPGKPPSNDLLQVMSRQGQLWRALLSGEKSGPDMLEINNYLDAATGLLITMRGVARRFIVRLPLVASAIVILFVGGLILMLSIKTTASFVAGAAGILASLGLSWKSVGGALGSVTAKLERQLWGAELDTAISDAITLLPETSQNKLDRRQKITERHELARQAAASIGPDSQLTVAAPEPSIRS